MIRDTVTAWPLYWPPGWPRTKYPERSRFGGCTVYGSVQGIIAELGRMGVEVEGAGDQHVEAIMTGARSPHVFMVKRA